MVEQTIRELLDAHGSDVDPREVEAYLRERYPSRGLRELSRSELRVGVSAALLFIGSRSGSRSSRAAALRDASAR